MAAWYAFHEPRTRVRFEVYVILDEMMLQGSPGEVSNDTVGTRSHMQIQLPSMNPIFARCPGRSIPTHLSQN